jgi:hypothetical protein
MPLARFQFHVTDDEGNVLPGASVEVRREVSGSPLAVLFSDRNGATPLGNPFQADSSGFAAFHVSGGAYRVTATSGAVSRVWRYVPIGLAAESDSLTTGVAWTFSTATTDSDPGAGFLRFNNATLASVTAVYLDNLSSLGADVSAWLDSFDNGGQSTERGVITLQTVDGAGLFVARVTGSVVDGTGYRKLTVTPLATSGSFTADISVNVSFAASGTNGVDGVTPGTPFTFSTTTTMADPGTGVIRLNNATLASVTAAAVDDLSAASGNPDVSAWVLSWDDSTNAVRGHIILKKQSAPQNFAVYAISGASTDNSGWTQLALTHVASAGSFSNSDLLSVEFTRSGNVGADGTSPVGKHTIWVPAGAMVTRTTNGAAAGTVETSTNKVMLKTLDFDATTQEFAQFAVRMPKSWDESTLSFQAVWSHAATTTNFGVVWGLEAVGLSDDDAADTAFGTAQTVTDTGGTTNDVYISPESSALTVGNSPSEGDWVVFQVKRVPSDGSDTMAIDARLHGISLFYTTNAVTDA